MLSEREETGEFCWLATDLALAVFGLSRRFRHSIAHGAAKRLVETIAHPLNSLA